MSITSNFITTTHVYKTKPETEDTIKTRASKSKVPSLAGFAVLKTSKVFRVYWQLTITYPCAPHQYKCFLWKWVFLYCLYMSLFQFGFFLRREEPSIEDSVEVEILETHIQRQEDTNLGVFEHKETAAVVVNVSRPAEILQQNQHLKRKRGKYFQYSGEESVKIGKFTSENGNKKNLEWFAEEFPSLKKSTVYTLKKHFESNFLRKQQKETFNWLRPLKHRNVGNHCSLKSWKANWSHFYTGLEVV